MFWWQLTMMSSESSAVAIAWHTVVLPVPVSPTCGSENQCLSGRIQGEGLKDVQVTDSELGVNLCGAMG